jgi:hypothetical protein
MRASLRVAAAVVPRQNLAHHRNFAQWAVKKTKRKLRRVKVNLGAAASAPATPTEQKLPFSNGEQAVQWILEKAIRADDAHQSEFIDAIHTIVPSLQPVFERKPSHALIMAQMLEPEKAFEFRVPWTDDAGLSRVNRGYRVQYSSTLGPYMGGLRFQKELSHSTVKSLAFDNIFSNALCGTIGAAAGGSDFDPRDKSEAEIMRFCQSFMTGMVANVGVGAGKDLPGVGIGVGKREVSYLYGQYKRITHKADSKLLWGGNQVIPSPSLLFSSPLSLFSLSHPPPPIRSSQKRPAMAWHISLITSSRREASRSRMRAASSPAQGTSLSISRRS